MYWKQIPNQNTVFKIIKCLILGFGLLSAAIAQVPTQEQLQTADAQLNQVYQQLRGTLNDAQKQQLKQAQRDWIKKRDALVAANPGNPQGALYQATMQRVEEFNGYLSKVKLSQLGQSGERGEISKNATPDVQQGNEESVADAELEQLFKKVLNILNPTKQKILKYNQQEWKEDRDRIVKEATYQPQSIYLNQTKSRLEKLNGILQVEIGKQKWIANESKTYTSLKHIEDKKPRLCAPIALNQYDFGIIDEKRKIALTVDNQRTINWGNIGTIRKWSLPSGALVGEVHIPCGILDLSYSYKDGSLLVINGPIIQRSVDEVNSTSIKESSIQGITELKLQLLGGEKVASDEDIVRHYHEFNYFSEKRLEYVKNNNLLNDITLATDGDGMITRDGLVLNKKTDEVIGKLGAVGELNSISSINVSSDGSKLMIDARNGLFSFSVPELSIKPISKLESDKVVKTMEGHTNTIDTNTGRVTLTDITCPIFNSKYQLISCKYLHSDSQSLNVRLDEKGTFSIPTPDLHHSPTLSAAENSDESSLALGIKGRGPSLGDYYGEIVQCDTKNFQISDRWKSDDFLGINFLAYIPEKISHQNVLITTIDGSIKIINPNTKRILSKIQIPGSKSGNCPTGTNVINIYQANEDGGISIVARVNDSLEEKERMYLFSNGGWVISESSDNYYVGNRLNSHLINFIIRQSIYPFEQFDLRLNRPDIVLERLGAPKEAIETAKSLRDKRLKRMGVTEDMLKPDFHLPELQIVGDVPASTSKDQLDLQIKATDDKYPLDRLRVYVNNVPVNGRDGELLRDQKAKSLERTIPIKLSAGRNKIQISVLNSAGAESLYANAEVNCTAERPKPKLYAVALGVSQYDRPEWCLKYAAKDATDLIGKLKAKAGSAYSEVRPLLLTDKGVTKESAAKIKEFLSTANIDDTVLIFMAGHGLLDDKYDYYFGTTDIDPAKPSVRGMPYEAIDNILAEVPSLKKALLMDTCHAGELDDDEKKELAASDGSATPAGIPAADTNSFPPAGKVAMRSIGTRGMQVKAVEGAKGKSDWYEKLQDMFVDLRRGSGATVISSSQGAEYAFESSEQSNGLFTYSLMEALDGKATPNKDGQITISSIGDYVKKRVQDLTKGKQNPNLRGVNLEEDFTLGSKK